VQDWSLREAGAEDADALGLIGAATFLETFAGVLSGPGIVRHCARVHTGDAYRRLIEGGARAWIAELDSGRAPIGYALLATPDLAQAGPGDLELKRLYTLSRFHGSGVGAALMDVVVTAARGASRLLLGAYAGNARALAFYTRQGFERIGERQFDVGGIQYDDLVLARALPPRL
jgi:ribosomal protein S18 acetylase RimI-like enzyme